MKSQNLSFKIQKGITLIALVITVIVLLILAGVGISLITGSEGLFGKAKEAGEKYNNAAEKEADLLNKILSGEFNSNESIIPNVPDSSKLPTGTTKYVTWEGSGTYTEKLSEIAPDNWYNYNESKWANIKTMSTDGSLEAYWVWIPRFAYKLPESATAKTIEVAFVEGTGKTVVLENGKKEQGYYIKDSEITTDNSGLYIKKTTDAHAKWIIHPAFTFGDKQLTGIWVAKYEASSSNPSASNGGGNVTNLKVQVKPNVTSWSNIATANIFSVCRAIQNDNGALGTVTGNTTVDTHMIKNIEWGAVTILSQSKYGYYDRVTNTSLQVWNNPHYDNITGKALSTANGQESSTSGSCDNYNSGNGPKASTTGNIYGIYDMAAGAWDQVAGVHTDTSVFGSSIETKYYDLYTNDMSSDKNYDGGIIGDMTIECLASNGLTWNNDRANSANLINPLLYRGGHNGESDGKSGVFAFMSSYVGSGSSLESFRPVLVAV